MKKRTLNEHRQIKEYQGSSEGWKYLDDLENTKEKRLKKLDEEITKVFSPQKLNDAAKAKLHEFKDVEFDDLEDIKEKKLKKLEEAHMRTVVEQNKDVDNTPEEIKKIQKELEYKDVEFNDLDQKDLIEEAKEMITNKIIKHFDDVLFEMVCEEMNKNYLFKESNYLTIAGMDEFEDVWYEFYHEHHGDILHQVRQSFTN